MPTRQDPHTNDTHVVAVAGNESFNHRKVKVQIQLGAVLLLMMGVNAFAIEAFRENFGGTGDFASNGLAMNGFETAGWDIQGFCGEDSTCENSDQHVEFRDGGLFVANLGNEFGESDFLRRTVLGPGSFIETVLLRDVVISTESVLGNSGIGLIHDLATEQLGLNEARISVSEFDANSDDWVLFLRYGEDTFSADVPSGTNVSLAISFDQNTQKITFEFDNDHQDRSAPLQFGPFDYQGRVSQNQSTFFFANAVENARADVLLDDWQLLSTEDVKGDFNRNGGLDSNDIDLLSAAILDNSRDLRFDLNDDSMLTNSDRDIWVRDLAKTWYGDANLDSRFDSSDFVQVFESGEYDDGVSRNSTWATGDWNGDREFDSGDFVLAFQGAGFENGLRPRAVSVPESFSCGWLVCLTVTTLLRSRRD